MIARISTAIFYAIVFFMLGIWSAGRMPSLKAAMENGVGMVSASVRSIGQHKPANPADDGLSGFAAAREAFGRGDLSGAIAAYEAIVKAQPDNYDALGELGNVYFNAGRIKEAATSYHDAAVLIARSGDGERARKLEPIIRKGDQALADDLLVVLAAPAAPTPQTAKP